MAQADWPLLILQPMRSLAQHLNSLVQCLLSLLHLPKSAKGFMDIIYADTAYLT